MSKGIAIEYLQQIGHFEADIDKSGEVLSVEPIITNHGNEHTEWRETHYDDNCNFRLD